MMTQDLFVAAAVCLLIDDEEEKNIDVSIATSSSIESTESIEIGENLPIPTVILIPKTTMAKNKSPMKSPKKRSPKKSPVKARTQLKLPRARAPPKKVQKPGQKNFSKAEVMSMLKLIDRILPIGPDQWDQVQEEHNEAFPIPGRDVFAIRRKYTNLARVKTPTGNPNCPDRVRLAKQIKHKLGAKADIGDGTEEFDLEHGFDGEVVVDDDSDEEEDDDVDEPLLGQVTQDVDEEEDDDIPTTVATVATSRSSSKKKKSKPSPPARQVRSYQKSIKDELLETMQLQALQTAKRDAQAEKMQDMYLQMATSFGTIIAAAITGKKKKKKHKDAEMIDSSDSDSDSDLE